MKKTQNIYLFRTIKKNIISFFAVGMMAITGISIYLGDQSAAQAILNDANNYFIENRLQTLEVTSPYGITEEDIAVMSDWDGVDAVEGGYSSIVLVDTNNGTGKTLVKAHALLGTMNLPLIVEGVLPTGENEVAVEQTLAKKEGVSVGDQIAVEHEGELKSDRFTVTAIINQPSYCYARTTDARGQSDIGIGSAYYYIAFPREAFNSSHYDNCYSTAYIRNDSMDQYHYFSENYKEKEAEFKARIETLGAERAALRYEAVKQTVAKKLEDARTELERQEKNLANGKLMLSYIFEIIGISSDFEKAMTQLESYEKLQEPMQEILSAIETGEQALIDGWNA